VTEIVYPVPKGPLANVIEVRRGIYDAHTGGIEHREEAVPWSRREAIGDYVDPHWQGYGAHASARITASERVKAPPQSTTECAAAAT